MFLKLLMSFFNIRKRLFKKFLGINEMVINSDQNRHQIIF